MNTYKNYSRMIFNASDLEQLANIEDEILDNLLLSAKDRTILLSKLQNRERILRVI